MGLDQYFEHCRIMGLKEGRIITLVKFREHLEKCIESANDDVISGLKYAIEQIDYFESINDEDTYQHLGRLPR